MGSLVHIQGELNNTYGPDIDNDSIYESGEDINIDHIEGEFSDDAVSKTSLAMTDEEEEMVAVSLAEAFGPRPIESIELVIKKTYKVIQKQGLYPKG